MEGAYNKVLDARRHVPDPSFTHFMEKLLMTVRCAYTALSSGIRCAGSTEQVLLPLRFVLLLGTAGAYMPRMRKPLLACNLPIMACKAS